MFLGLAISGSSSPPRGGQSSATGRLYHYLWICGAIVTLHLAFPLFWFIPDLYVAEPETVSGFTPFLDASSIHVPPSQVESVKQFDRTDDDWKGFHPNRTIAFVHLGKAGGMTVRSSTSLACRLAANSTEAFRTACIDKHFLPNATLSRQVNYYFHMHAYNKSELEGATSYLFVLRHPVERVISAYRYSHPANCRGEVRTGRIKPYGCYLERFLYKKGSQENQVFAKCFRSAEMETFAQAVLSPYPPFNTSHLGKETTLRFRKMAPGICRRMAHRVVRGLAHAQSLPNAFTRALPHMKYNYEYYMDHTVWQNPQKEVFGIRTEHEWNDLRAIDLSIGGSGVFRGEGRAISHGSGGYLPSPLTTDAYEKLCCVLEQEIANYQDLLHRIQNLNDAEKKACMDKVRQSCGIGDRPLEEWRKECQARIEHDRPVWQLPQANNRRVQQTAT
ncbi:expressed unknown protein [Seminavis robusta]|uniref:Uncharacterized protein n=1 Tax=Seminavis robusta TaxID=568900 RepID=A0A9N8HPT3_9STRA|nr:expressed unknown protein [Seminavis robusta]|eukprot:Sro1361_g266230.1 n/a (446) ;mRNA; f:20429-21853